MGRGKYIRTEEHKNKMCSIKKGKFLSTEHRENIGKSIKGRSSHRKGKKLPEETKMKMSKSSMGHRHSEETKRKISESNRYRIENGIQPSTRCKWFDVHGLKCQGTYEKKYIVERAQLNLQLPQKSKGVKTPFGYYFPDFEFGDHYIEIKSELMLESNQFKKINWTSENIKEVKIINLDKMDVEGNLLLD